jgi:hypothetical protein
VEVSLIGYLQVRALSPSVRRTAVDGGLLAFDSDRETTNTSVAVSNGISTWECASSHNWAQKLVRSVTNVLAERGEARLSVEWTFTT